MTEKQEKATKKDAIYITIILALLGGIGYFAYSTGNLKKQIDSLNTSTAQLEKEKEDLNQIIVNSGIIEEAENNDIKNNLLLLKAEFDAIETDNADLKDSIATKQQEVGSLLAKIDSINNLNAADRKKAYGQIYKLKKETETLREIMKGYIHTIDSLNTVNIGLQNTIIERDETISTISNDLNNVKTQKEDLENKVAQGSVLQAGAMSALAIKVRSNGSQVETSRAKRAEQFKSCFTVMKNNIAAAGNKKLSMRIIGPDGKEIPGSSPDVFTVDGKTIKAAISRTINYQNANTDVCIYYELESDVTAGTYQIEVYCENYRIGKTSFALK